MVTLSSSTAAAGEVSEVSESSTGEPLEGPLGMPAEKTFASKVARVGCALCTLGCAAGIVIALVVAAQSSSELENPLEGWARAALAEDDGDDGDDAAEPQSAAAAGSNQWSCAITTGETAQSVSACSAEPWCAQLRETAAISFEELRLLQGSAEQDQQPLMMNALDYRYFDACRAAGSINFWFVLLFCELLSAEQVHLLRSGGGGGTASSSSSGAQSDLSALEIATRSRAIHEPLQELLQALQPPQQRPVVFYCANPS